MSRLIPYPMLAVWLLVMWLLLQQSLNPGHFFLGGVIAVIASHAMAALQPERPRMRRLGRIVKLVVLVTLDVIRSNVAVMRIILQGRVRNHTAGFLVVPLQLTNRYGLVVLACIVTATPGSAWIEYHAARSTVLIHVLDLVDEQEWIETLKSRYETLLLEIFE
jgi:multicomponent K+:H+ antiporter subunit E